MSVNISTSNNLTDEEYCPLFFNFGKQCNEKSKVEIVKLIFITIINLAMLSEEMRSGNIY